MPETSINDKPTGAVVGQQPLVEQSFRNNKAGSPLNLLRWASPRTIKETFYSVDYRYPFWENKSVIKFKIEVLRTLQV
jgi:hypothetical protein